MSLPQRRAIAVFAATTLGLLTAALAILLALLEADPSYGGQYELRSHLGDFAVALSFVAVGGLVTTKRPDNAVGWSLLLAACGILSEQLLRAYAELALLAKPELGLPAGAAAQAVAAGSWTALMGGVFLLLLLFPRGSLPSARWSRLAPAVLGCLALVWAMIATAPGHLDPPLEPYANPLAITSDGRYADLAQAIAGAFLIPFGLAAVDLLRRFRRSRSTERQQFKWLAASVGLLVAVLPLAAATDFSGAGGTGIGLALIALPVSVGIAVLRYRLYDIDVVINRTLVYGSLSALLAGAYLGLVVLLQLALRPLTSGNGLAVALSTLAVAALVRPARTGIQEAVDRRFYRRKYDAQRTLDAFAGRLRDEIDLDTLTGELRHIVAETMQPAHVSLWLREERR